MTKKKPLQKIKGYIELFYGEPVWVRTLRGNNVLAITEDGKIGVKRPKGAKAVLCTITYAADFIKISKAQHL